MLTPAMRFGMTRSPLAPAVRGHAKNMASSAVSDSGESFSETTAVSHSTGDTVHLRSPSGSKDHFVGRITRMWVDEMDEEEGRLNCSSSANRFCRRF